MEKDELKECNCIIDEKFSDISTNALQNKVITEEFEQLTDRVVELEGIPAADVDISFVTTETIEPGEDARVQIVDLGTEDHIRNIAFKFFIPKGESGKNGVDGRDGKDGTTGSTGTNAIEHIVAIAFRSSVTQPKTPTGGSLNVATGEITLPKGWSRTDNVAPPVWMSTGMFNTLLPDNPEWSTPIKISGKDGENGADGTDIEFIYKRTLNHLIVPDKPENQNIDDYVPEGWKDNPQGISEFEQCEWVCVRSKLKNGVWSDWTNPSIWSKWGVNGMDGDGVQFIFLLNDGDTPDNPTPSNMNTDEYQQKGDYEGKEYVPTGWKDDPQGVSETARYEWVCQRHRRNEVWGAFSEPAVWAKFGEKGDKGDTGPQGPVGPQGPTGSDGVSGIPGVDFVVKYCLGTETSYTGTSSPSGEEPSGWTDYVPTITSAYPYIWCIQGRREYTTIENSTINWGSPFRLTGTKGLPGETGPQGPTGPTGPTGPQGPSGGRGQIVYPAGIYDPYTTYSTTDKKAPYVYDSVAGEFYVLNYIMDWKGTSQGNILPSQSDKWVQLESFEALYTKVGIIANGLIGSAVFNGDYMFSQQGINASGGASSNYEKFNKDDPYNSSNEFRPSFCVNLRTGQAWMGAGKIAMNSDGSGYVANQQIKWDAEGNVMLDAQINDSLSFPLGNTLYTFGPRKTLAGNHGIRVSGNPATTGAAGEYQTVLLLQGSYASEQEHTSYLKLSAKRPTNNRESHISFTPGNGGEIFAVDDTNSYSRSVTLSPSGIKFVDGVDNANLYPYEGITDQVTIGDYTLYFKNGILYKRN